MILVRFAHSWPLRRSEWMLALITLGIGLVYAFDFPLFDLPHYATMKSLMSQHWWAVLALAVGTIRLTALYINGAVRASPHFRGVGAFVSCMLWLSLFIGAVASPLYGVTVIIWPIFLMFDASAVMDAARDARISDDKANMARRGKDAAGVE